MDTRSDFHRHLQEIQNDVLAMGSMVAKALSRAMEALKNRDLTLAQQIIDDDKKINARRFEIEEKCIQLIATQAPMASDLRVIIGVLNIITELERIGDHAEGNARIAVMIGNEPPLKPYVGLDYMTKKSVDMLNRSMDVMISRDVEAAKKIILEDDTVDHTYDQIFRELLTFMLEDPRTISRATRLIWVAHNLERSADRVTNICERVIFMATGKMEEQGGSKY
jgi:phosphate transport system protein